MQRLDKILSSLGYGSRRSVADLIAAGRVSIDGSIATRADQKGLPTQVCLDGAPLEFPDGLLVMLHKPLGYTCTHSSAEGPSIYDLLPARWRSRNPAISSVGRLDKETSGLLLITDQGRLIQKWTSPKSQCHKTYQVSVDHPLDPSLIDVFARGDLMLNKETTPCRPARLIITSALTAELTLTEGRYHQVRRMFASQGYLVTALHRSHFGPYTLDSLAPGQYSSLDIPPIL
jgi:16S rRNA pseudouridine516 synthase